MQGNSLQLFKPHMESQLTGNEELNVNVPQNDNLDPGDLQNFLIKRKIKILVMIINDIQI